MFKPAKNDWIVPLAYLARDLSRPVHLHDHPVLGQLLLDEHHLLLTPGHEVAAWVVGALVNLGEL